MPLPPTTNSNPYKQEKWGVYGELGEGSGVKIRFIQTAIRPNQFEQIKLVPDIEGSEKWDVRDLFQREIDEDRVGEIISYLKKNDDVKFFNPLTLVVLPMNESKTQVISETTFLSIGTEKLNDIEYTLFERDDFFKINIDQNLDFARIAWNDEKCNIVAIDGQHRLSALKRMHMDGQLENTTWKIPVVLLTMEKLKDNSETVISILETVRRTFVNINEKAEHINTCRKILLDDFSINAICVQELVEVSHKNDNKAFSERQENILPLIFFEWKGVVKNRVPKPSPTAVKEIIEIKKWFEHYLIGSEEDPIAQNVNLMLNDMPYGTPRSFGKNKILTPEDAKNIRKYIREDFIKGLNLFLIKFAPYKEYIESSINIEKKALKIDQNDNSDIRQQAFLKLRFGRCNPLENLKDEIEECYKNLLLKYEEAKNDFLQYIRLDIGMRGIMFAFGELKRILDKYNSSTMLWFDYSDEIYQYFNEIYNDGWFIEHDDDDLDAEKRNLLTDIMYNELGSVQQYYKLENMNKLLGGFLILVLISKIRNNFTYLSDDNISEIIDEFGGNIKKSYEKGFKDEYKTDHRHEYVQLELNSKANEYAANQAKEKLEKLLKYLGLDDV